MNYITLHDKLKNFAVFSVHDIRQVDPDFHRRRLNDWQDKGYIRKVIKGFYVFSDTAPNDNILFEIANRIYKPSYVSLESALSYYHLIPEAVYSVTSVSTRRTYAFMSSLSRFSYRAVKPEFFFGYALQSSNHRAFKIARPEKAVLDFFYLNPQLKTAADYESLRVDRDRFLEIVDLKALGEDLSKYPQKSVRERISRFLEFLNIKK